MKTIVITGATGAVGKATVMALAGKGNVEIVLAGRNTSKLDELRSGLKGENVKVQVVPMDMSDSESVKQAVAKIKSMYTKIDALINVAAVYKAQKTTTKQNRETMFATNHLAPFALSNGLMPLLNAAPGSKILTVTAPSGTKLDFENLNGEKKFSSLGAFGGTKMMNLLFSFELGKKFQGTDHAAIAFHPGLVKSDLLNEGPAFLRGLLRLMSSNPGKTANAIVKLVTEGDPKNQNGKFYNNSLKEMKAASFANDDSNQKKLWLISERMLN
jgi:NAD(P)-dependent dehydrogenase (short-subunit alcohol dehydrogenase family)